MATRLSATYAATAVGAGGHGRARHGRAQLVVSARDARRRPGIRHGDRRSGAVDLGNCHPALCAAATYGASSRVCIRGRRRDPDRRRSRASHPRQHLVGLSRTRLLRGLHPRVSRRTRGPRPNRHHDVRNFLCLRRGGDRGSGHPRSSGIPADRCARRVGIGLARSAGGRRRLVSGS